MATVNLALSLTPTYIAGEITDNATELPIKDVVISHGTSSVTTDSLGRYRLAVPPGAYTIVVTATGYMTVTEDVTVVPGIDANADFALDLIDTARLCHIAQPVARLVLRSQTGSPQAPMPLLSLQ